MEESSKSSLTFSASALNESADTSVVNQPFMCQRCHAKLNLDTSFKDLDKFTLVGIKNSFNTNPEASETDDSALAEENIIITRCQQQTQENIDVQNFGSVVTSEDVSPSEDPSDDNQNGFLLLGDTNKSPGNLGLRYKVYGELFKFLNEESDVEHPLCQACADKLMDLQASRLSDLEEECSSLAHYLEYLDTSATSSVTSRDFHSDLQNLEKEEEQLQEEMFSLKLQMEEARKEYSAELESNEKLVKQYNELQQYYSELKRQLFLLEDDRASASNQLKFAESQLTRLSKTNVLNAAFHIWYDGHFATINGFRLGRLSSVPVEWAEINAALGQCALLLTSVAKQIQFQFERFEIRPVASSSEVISRKDHRRLPLYSSPSIFTDSKFDAGISAFLSCIAELQAYIKRTSDVSIPHYIREKGIIEENGVAYSVRLHNNSDEKWTKALRLMLQNMKWIVTWLSTLPSHSDNRKP